jgi:hypothetical protein
MNFEGRTLVIASMHQKEKVIAPLLENNLGVKCIVSDQLNTDVFGTFSGDISRDKSPLDVLRLKCNAAMDLTNVDLAVASEGSFGNHPMMYFTSADDELLMLVDRKNKVEIVERELSLQTNLNAAYVNDFEELKSFADKVLFPSHAICMKDSEIGGSYLVKGIQSMDQLKRCFHSCINEFNSVYVETDMRAMYNPTRMKVIEVAAAKLCAKIASKCPNCSFPGYSVQTVLTGLPCSNCHFPTKSTKAFVYQCAQCAFEERKNFPHEKTAEDPMYCDFCNP